MIPKSAVHRLLCAAFLILLLAIPAMLARVHAQPPTPTAAATPTTAITPTATKTLEELLEIDRQVATGTELLVRLGLGGALAVLILVVAISILSTTAKKAGEGIGEHLYNSTLGRRLKQRDEKLKERERQRTDTHAHQKALDSGLAAYLQWLQNELQYLPQIPLDQRQQDLTLNEVYVSLRVVKREQIDRFYDYMLGKFGGAEEYRARREAFGALGRSQHVYRLLSDPEYLPREYDQFAGQQDVPDPDADEQEETTKRLLLVGDAGSGKTTTLHYGALMLASHFIESDTSPTRSQFDLHCQERLLPIYIRLTLVLTYLREKYRNDRSRLTNSPADLLLEWVDFDFPRQIAARDFPPALISERMRAGGCLVLLDGLDEAGDSEQREYVKQLIINVVQACPKNRYIVASRPFDGVSQGWPHFLERRLSPLDAEEIQLLLRRWFNAIHRAEGPSPRRRRSATQEFDELWSKLEMNPRLFDMATNPLLLTSMAVLMHGGDPLPPERAKIYHRLISLTLVRWREAQIRAGQPPLDSDHPIRLFGEESDDDVRRRLQQLAAWMLQHQRREMLLREAQDLLAPVYEINRKWLPEHSRNHVQALLRLLTLHSGLFQERDQGYSFIHFTLQEYLTARDYDEHDDIDGLAKMWREHRWRETILLAVGHWATSGFPMRAHRLLEKLLRTDEIGALFLAAEALDEANAHSVSDLRGVLDDTIERLRMQAFDPVRCPDPRARNHAAGLLNRLGADTRPELDLLRPEYWAHRIEPGPFIMGDDDSQFDDEKPAFTSTIRRPYALARFPVTNNLYLRFLEDLEHSHRSEEWQQRRPRSWPGSRYPAGEGNYPVVGISWLDATAFAAWANEQLRKAGVLKEGEQVRLPTEPEWERAAAYPITVPADTPSTGRRTYPWGDWSGDESVKGGIPANIDQSHIAGCSVVGIFPHGAAVCGAQDLTGNVWEWCSTRYSVYPLPEEAAPPLPNADQDEETYLLRGGSWNTKRSEAHCTHRFGGRPGLATNDTGFRLIALFTV